MSLAGQTDPDQTRLLWTVQGWPEGAVGFDVMRRERNTDEWISLSPAPVYPEVSPERNWAGQGLDARQAEYYRSKLEDYIQGDAIQLTGRAEFLSQLREFGMRAGDRLKLVDDYDLAIMLGFGFIDSSIDAETDYEYGLFEVHEDGTKSSVPVARYTTIRLKQDDSRVKVNLQVRQKGADIALYWKSDLSLQEQLGIMSYNIYRREMESDDWTRIRSPGISPRERAKDYLLWEYLDQESDAFTACHFAVAPVNKFQMELAKTVVEYKPLELRPAEVVSLQMVHNTRVRVNWEVDKKLEFLIGGYHVERALAGSTNYVRVTSKPIKAGMRAHVDMKPPLYSELVYRLVTLDREGLEFYSSPATIYAENPRAPKTAENFKLTFYRKDGKYFIRGNWDAPKSSDNVAKYWVFDDASNSRKLTRHLAGTVVGTNSYSWSLGYIKGGRMCQFGIQPVSNDGVPGEKILRDIYIPVLTPPRLQQPSATLLEDGNIQLSWEYPMLNDMLGFRIFLNGKSIAKESEIPPAARSWIIHDYPDTHTKNSTLKFDVVAVFPLCMARSLQPALLNLTKERPDRSIPPPGSFSARILGNYKGERWAYFSMGNSYVDPKVREHLKGWLLYISNEEGEFDPADATRIEFCSKYYFPIPDEYKDGTIYFRLAMEGKHRCGGLHKRSSLRLSHKSWEKVISEEKYADITEINTSLKRR